MSGASSAYLLAQNLDLPEAAPLHAALRDRLDAAQTLVLDGSQVERVATPCVQILVAALLSGRANGTGFELRTPSQSLSDAFADLGLSQFFAQQEV